MAPEVGMRAFVLVLALCLSVSACQDTLSGPPPGPVPVDPDPTPRPTTEGWALKTTLLSVTGPDLCSWSSSVGRSADWSLLVKRADSEVAFLYGVPTDEVLYAGSLFSNEFSASSTGSVASASSCGGRRVEYVADSRVSGRFAADGRTLTGSEVWSYRFTSGETVELRFGWSATAPR
jgi:hypothetical protein